MRGGVGAPRAIAALFFGRLFAVRLFLAERRHSTVGALLRGRGLMRYCFVLSPLCCAGGALVAGKIRRRSTTMAAPQQAHCHCARAVTPELGGVVGIVRGRLNTNSFSNVISRLLLGCRKPKLRERLNPLGKTCCNTRRRNCAPLTVRSVFQKQPIKVFNALARPVDAIRHTGVLFAS